MQVVLLAVVAILIVTGTTLLKQRNRPEAQTGDPASASQPAPTVPETSAQELDRIRKTQPLQLIDIRDMVSFQQQHIQSSINLPLETIKDNAGLIDKTKPIVVIDEIPTVEGKLLTEHFNKEGLSATYLSGGLEQYRLEGLPLIYFGDPESLLDRSKAEPISALSLKERMDKGERFVFIDVRLPEAYEQGHFAAAQNVPLEQLEQLGDTIPPGKVVLVDDNPVRSYQAAVRLYDLQHWGARYLSDSLQTLKEALDKKPGE